MPQPPFVKPLLLALVMLFLPAALQAQEQAETIVRGHVVNEAGRPVQGVQVVVVGTNRGALTNAEGVFVIRGAPEGRQTLQATRVLFTTAKLTVNVVRAQVQQVDFRLREVENTLRIALLSRDLNANAGR